MAAACKASLSFIISWSSLKLMSIELVMPSNHLILCGPLILLPSIFPSVKVFSNKSALCIRWPKYWSFSFSISPSNEYSGLISFRIDWFDLLAVQGTLKSLLQHYSLKASVLQCPALFMVQLSHPYLTTRKTIALTIWTFVGKLISLLFNTLSRFVIAFLPRSKCLLIMAAVTICSDFRPQENQVCHCFHCFPISLPWSDGTWNINVLYSAEVTRKGRTELVHPHPGHREPLKEGTLLQECTLPSASRPCSFQRLRGQLWVPCLLPRTRWGFCMFILLLYRLVSHLATRSSVQLPPGRVD